MGGRKKRMKQKTSLNHLVRKSVPVPQEYLKSLDGCEQLLAPSESQCSATDGMATAVVADSTNTSVGVEQMIKFSRYTSMQDQLKQIIQQKEQALKVTAATYADAKMQLIEERKKHDAILYEYKTDLVDSNEQYQVLLNDRTIQDKLFKKVISERDTLKEAQGRFYNFKSKHDEQLRLLESEFKETKIAFMNTELEKKDVINRIKNLEKEKGKLQEDKETELSSLRMKLKKQTDAIEEEKKQDLKIAKDEFQKVIETLKNQNVVDLKIMEEKIQTRITTAKEQKEQDLRFVKEESQKDIKALKDQKAIDMRIMEERMQTQIETVKEQKQQDLQLAKEEFQKDIETLKKKNIDDLKTMGHTKDSVINEKLRKIQAKDLYIQEQANEIKVKDLSIQEQAKEICSRDLCIKEQANEIRVKDLWIEEQIEDIYAKDVIIEEKMKESCAKDTLIENILVEEVCEIHAKNLEIKVKNNELQLKDKRITEMNKELQMKDFELIILKYNQDGFNNEILTLKEKLKSLKKEQKENAINQQSKLLVADIISGAMEQLQLGNIDGQIKQLKDDKNKMKREMQEFMSTINNELDNAKAVLSNKFKTEITKLNSQLDSANEQALKYMKLNKNSTNIGKLLLDRLQDIERMNIQTLMKRFPFKRHINCNKLQDFIIGLKLDTLKLFQDNSEVVKATAKAEQMLEQTTNQLIACTNDTNLDSGNCEINEYDLAEAMFTCKTKLQLDCETNNINKTGTSLDCETDLQLDCRICSTGNNNTPNELDKPSCKNTEINEVRITNTIAHGSTFSSHITYDDCEFIDYRPEDKILADF